MASSLCPSYETNKNLLSTHFVSINNFTGWFVNSRGRSFPSLENNYNLLRRNLSWSSMDLCLNQTLQFINYDAVVLTCNLLYVPALTSVSSVDNGDMVRIRRSLSYWGKDWGRIIQNAQSHRFTVLKNTYAHFLGCITKHHFQESFVSNVVTWLNFSSQKNWTKMICAFQYLP